MFFTYLRRELRRRMRQAIFITLGLAVGIGLVITVTAASAGVKNAQASVLHSLYGVGTDITVTKAPTAGSFTPGSFNFGGHTGTTKKKAGATNINVNRLRSTDYGELSDTYVTKVKSLKNVSEAVGGLVLTDTKISGSIGAINFNNSSGDSGRGSGAPSGSGTTAPSFNGGFTPTQTTVDGVDLTGSLGPLSSLKVTSGSAFTASDTDSDVALISSDYATSDKLSVGSTVTLATTNLKVIGIVSTTSSDSSNDTDIYIPLEVAQTLASMKNEVNTIYVSASNNNDITSLAADIKNTVSGSTVTDESSLASEVTGSLSSASTLVNSLGKWVAIAVLLAAFLLAALLTLSAVTRRIREFGTLKALGWKSGRVIRQVMGESIVTGILGGVVGIGLGFLGAKLVDHFSGSLSATLDPTGTTTAPTAAAGAFGGRGFGGGGRAADTASTVSVHLIASVTIGAIIAAVVLAIAGGLIAGAVGGWRAARLRPADALSKVG
ncbi:MAG: ABC transporter permease [Streptosporangiaceae bacterium]|jgi:ABC-type antimicrobial peptide transport system permease subunit